MIMPELKINNTDQNWALALGNAIYATNREDAIRNLAELLLRTKIQRSNPELYGEDLDRAVSEELFELVAHSYSDSDLYRLIAYIKDYDGDIDKWLFGEGEDYVSCILVPDFKLRSTAENAYSGYRDFLGLYPERVPSTFEHEIRRYTQPDDKDEEARLIIDELARMIRDRRSSALSKLINEPFSKSSLTG